MAEHLASTIRTWREAPDISARSVLVTILGDAILPVTKTVWLANIFALALPFGFSERLVRTSLSRLAAEGWLTTQRVGRQSRYSLTPLAVSESEQANRRIYDDASALWDGSWTLVVTDSPLTSQNDRDVMGKHLGWHGFVPLGRGVLGAPTATVDETVAILDLVGLATRPPIVRAEIVEIDRLVDDGYFAHVFPTDEIEKAYTEFLDRYDNFASSASQTEPLDAFVVRTMLVHDLRRIRLRSIEVPRRLRPRPWVGDAAYKMAAGLYRTLQAPSAIALSDILEIPYPASLPDRFPIGSAGAS